MTTSRDYHRDHHDESPADTTPVAPRPSRATVAERFRVPWWYHLGIGVVIAVLVFSMARDFGVAASLAVIAAALVVLGVMMWAFWRSSGLWWGLGDLGPGSRRTWYWLMGGAFLFIFGASAVSASTSGAFNLAASVILSVMIGVIGTAASYRIDAQLREEIASGETTPKAVAELLGSPRSA